MKIRSFVAPHLLGAMLALGPACFPGHAQTLHRLTFKGVCDTVDSSGKAVRRAINDRTLILEWAGRAGVTNYRNLVLAFHPNVDARGDSIEIVNARTGAHVTTVFPLFFPETAAVTTRNGTVERRFAYVYNLYQAEFSRGTAILTEQALVNKQGRTNRFIVSGQMQWYQLPEGSNNLRFCSGTFKVNKPIKPAQ
ncbi:MAG TPA: hypothetical protein VEH04_10030 [Verrucomicrobiae bacterium]|nr:hypothetical protein [Verrucomicrobiae bacterium]